MLKPAIVEAGNSLHQRCRWAVDVWISSVGTQNLTAHLVIVQLNLKSILDIGDRAARANIKIVGPDADDLQVVRLQKALNDFGFRRSGGKPGRDIGALKP